MNQLKKIISDSEAQFGDGVEVKMWARTFAGWETDEVLIQDALYLQTINFIFTFFGNFFRLSQLSW